MSIMPANAALLALLSVIALQLGHAVKLQVRIHGGKPTRITSYPHQVSIKLDDRHNCGGSIIGERHILTAAHCVVDIDYSPYSNLKVHAGTSGGHVYDVAEGIAHPDYELDDEIITAVNDVGILKLATPIKFDKYQQPIALPTQPPKNKCNGTTIGWGRTESGKFASTLQKLNVTVLTAKTCQALLVSKIYDTQICAHHGDKRGACHGDSGGPLIVDNVIVGIASWVERDICATEWPDVYTNVYSFVDFIKTYMNNTVECEG